MIVTGCWATSDREAAAALPGVDAVVGHHEDVAAELSRLLDLWQGSRDEAPREEVRPQAGIRPPRAGSSGSSSLPLLGHRQTGRQRAYLKIQDGCDAHCTYCIIPTLRPALWSKPVEDAVEEATRLTAAGHVEVVLTGIFLGAYGQPTALRRRQAPAEVTPLARLIDALCTEVSGLRRLRLSSLEPGDLTPGLLAALRTHEQVVPHFHLPLQSGSDALLRRMNRQYTRGDFLRMVGRVRAAFDRPALTTDVIVGFPGETDEEFARTVEVVDEAAFIHVHAFSYSPRPGTAAARWTGQYVRGPVVNDRIDRLRAGPTHTASPSAGGSWERRSNCSWNRKGKARRAARPGRRSPAPATAGVSGISPSTSKTRRPSPEISCGSALMTCRGSARRGQSCGDEGQLNQGGRRRLRRGAADSERGQGVYLETISKKLQDVIPRGALRPEGSRDGRVLPLPGIPRRCRSSG